MGVTGLWKLIEPCGKPVPVETLEGKILAVDISIWLHQVVKGFQDSKGSALPNAHLLGLFHRLCKLMYYRVKPVFVFDGCVPQLKRDTIARRQQQRSKLNTEAERIQALLLQALAKEKVVQQALGANVELLLKSPSKRATAKRAAREEVDDIFKLPDIPESSKNIVNSDAGDDSWDGEETSFSTDDSSYDESNARHHYNTNLQLIDVKSEHFKELPADVRHEILVDIKETRKQSSWGRLHELPARGDDFSVFQMKRLLKRRAVQESLEEAQQEMGGSTLTYAELTNLFTEQGILEANILERGSKQISSDEHTRYLLVRDLKKKLSQISEDEKKIVKSEIKTEESKIEPEEKKSEDMVIGSEDKKMGKEYDTDLQLALAMSLDQTKVYSETDYEYESNEQIKLNRAQRNRLQNAAIGPARAYMIEYGGMNDEEVDGIMEQTQVPSEFEEKFAELNENLDEQKAIIDSIKEPKAVIEVTNPEGKSENSQNETESDDIRLHVSSDSDTDTDLEEVTEATDFGNNDAIAASTVEVTKDPKLEIVVNLTPSVDADDDLFADIFEGETDVKEQIVDAMEVIEEIQIKKYADDSNTKKSNLESEMLKPLESEVDADRILSNLQAQLENVKHIKLDDIKIDSTIEVSDDDEDRTVAVDSSTITPVKTEIIEICDSDDGIPKLSKSPNLKTPQKNRSILEYYQADYVVKRTPDKEAKDETEDVPKVTSPFFVNKTPKSSRKRTSGEESNSQSPTPKKEISKASKSLFENERDGENSMENDGVQAIEQPPLNTEDLIAEAAKQLKDQKTDEELQEIASNLAKERMNLENERNRQDRMGMSINQRMSIECQELLRLFGIPYIVAPMEAEAQCAFLDSIELTNGTITDDSDIWLFGGRTVYKNFFAQNKHVLEFRVEKIENSFNCDRNKLIQLACLVGSDYTTGVHGIGAVTALEILASFASPKSNKEHQKSNEENMRDLMNSVLATLVKFKDWWEAQKFAVAPPGSSARLSLRKKLKNIELHDGFPSLAVVEAYLTPKIDDSRDAFSWGYPDVESIREYAKKTFGWTTTKTNEILGPVLKRLDDKKSQANIRNYFQVKSAISVKELKVSKRVQKAIDRMSGKIDAETPEKPIKPKRKREVRSKKNNTPNPTEEETDINTDQHMDIATTEDASVEQPTTSKSAQRLNRKRPAETIHSKNAELIPQREKDKAQMAENKAKAAAILKKDAKTKNAPKKNRQS